MTRTELEAIAKPNEVVSDFQYIENGTDENGYKTYKIVYISNPANFKLVHIDPDSKLAVLEDLDYVPPTV